MAAAALAQTPALVDPRLIVALDVPTAGEARARIEALGDAVSFYKVGLELFASDGMALARELKDAGKQVFLDWKLHDIGATVEKAAAALAARGAGDLLTVHARPQVMAAAMRGVEGSDLKVLGVTVLTSLSDADLAELGYGFSAADLVEQRVRQALDCGVDGVVSSPLEAARARALAEAAGRPDFLIVTPGVRPEGADKGDQQRVATPRDALRAGATHLVVARPVVAADNPLWAAATIVESIDGFARR